MIKINDDSIIVGQIKQLLHNFNLPKCYIGNSNSKDDFSFLQKGYMIRDNNLYYKKKMLVEGHYLDWKLLEPYIENKKYLNLTDNLKIESKYYDINTHIYLGKYLRFLRDYHNVNLMSMYNCSISKSLDKSVRFLVNTDEGKKVVTWNPDDNDIYIVPIYPTINNNYASTDYTVYVKNNFEITTVLYNIETNSIIDTDYLDDDFGTDINSILYNLYHREGYCQSNDYPYLYNIKIIDINDIFNYDKLYDYKNYFCLLIKVPKDYDDSIVVLEGDYTNKCTIKPQFYEYNLKDSMVDLERLTNPQLLSNENTNNYLLSDRLIEYLTGNAITNISMDYDISKLQTWLNKNKDELKEKYNINLLTVTPNKMWQLNMTYDLIQLYYYFLNNPDYNNTPYYDFIGYCDSTMEKLLESIGLHDKVYDYGGIV